MTAETFATVKEYAGLARDIVVMLGIPALFAVGKWLYDQRMSTLNDQISLLKQQVEQSKVLQYDNAWAVIEGQKALFQAEIEGKEQQIKTLGTEHGKKDKEIESLQTEISELMQKTAALENARAAIEDPEEGLGGREILMRIFKFFGEAAIHRAKIEQQVNARSADSADTEE